MNIETLEAGRDLQVKIKKAKLLIMDVVAAGDNDACDLSIDDLMRIMIIEQTQARIEYLEAYIKKAQEEFDAL